VSQSQIRASDGRESRVGKDDATVCSAQGRMKRMEVCWLERERPERRAPMRALGREGKRQCEQRRRRRREVKRLLSAKTWDYVGSDEQRDRVRFRLGGAQESVRREMTSGVVAYSQFKGDNA